MDDITRSNSLADLLSRRREGIGRFQRINPIANQIAHAPQPAVWSADKERQRLPVKRRCRTAAAECTAGCPRAPRRVTQMLSSTDTIRLKQSRVGARLRSCYGTRGLL
jgi:hypothetical protein